MNPTRHHSQRSLLERLERLLSRLLIRYGEPALVEGDGVTLFVDVRDTDGGKQHVLVIAAGYPPPQAIEGIGWRLVDSVNQQVVAEGVTGSRGVSLLPVAPPEKSSSPATYQLRLEQPVAPASLAGSHFTLPVPSNQPALAAATGDAAGKPREKLSAEPVAVYLERDPADYHWSVEMAVDDAPFSLAVCRLIDQKNVVIKQHLVVLHRIAAESPQCQGAFTSRVPPEGEAWTLDIAPVADASLDEVTRESIRPLLEGLQPSEARDRLETLLARLP